MSALGIQLLMDCWMDRWPAVLDDIFLNLPLMARWMADTWRAG